MSPTQNSPDQLAGADLIAVADGKVAGVAGQITGVLEPGSLRKRGRLGEDDSTSAARRSSTRNRGKPVVEAVDDEEELEEKPARKNRRKPVSKKAKSEGDGESEETKAGVDVETVAKEEGEEEASDSSFVGEPFSEEEARRRWPDRYKKKEAENGSRKKKVVDPDEITSTKHYRQATVDNVVYSLYDDVYVKSEPDKPDYIGRIVEFFEGSDQRMHFTAQWFYRTIDTVIQEHSLGLEDKRVFLSQDKNVNALDCIVSRIRIVRLEPNTDLLAKERTRPVCDLYYDMSYSTEYSTFQKLPPVPSGSSTSDASSTVSTSPQCMDATSLCEPSTSSAPHKVEMTLLDLYCGCGAMSTGLCFGANISGVNLVTKWAVDLNTSACESLKINHPETEVRNENAENFLMLLKEWVELCSSFGLTAANWTPGDEAGPSHDNSKDIETGNGNDDKEYEVQKFVGIRFGNPNDPKIEGLQYLVRWKGFGPSHDTWEPVKALSNCKEAIESFVRKGFQNRILPLPGLVDIVCGGPPCQGVSGYNRFRKVENPLEDEKNRQMLVYMDIVEFLKPKFVLMENVVDLLKFKQGLLGRYALGRLVDMNYQARLGILAAGCYGLAQFRMRCFIWGAHPSQTLPQFPLPTHDVFVRGGVPVEFQGNLVAFNENEKPPLQKALVLEDAISDLPAVTNSESRDVMEYTAPPNSDFQSFIRLSREGLNSPSTSNPSFSNQKLYDHIPLQLNDDDFQRVCQIPKRKGACFRDLPGVLLVGNVVKWDPAVKRVLLPSGKPLVPDYAMTFVDGKSAKPFARLWWDETVPTVMTRAEPHNHALLHPLQDRVLTVRENARLQGFPDFYRLHGPVKERYMQVGNAVAVPVARALGYGLGLAYHHSVDDQPLFSLPALFPRHLVAETTSDVASEVSV